MTRSPEVWDTLCRVIFNFVTRMRCDLYLLKREREGERETCCFSGGELLFLQKCYY